MNGLRIGDVARLSRVNLETVRFYERRGLLPKPPRAASGYRAFQPDAVRRVRLIKRMQALGFSLKEIKELLSLGTDPDATCADIQRRTIAKLADIDNKILELRRMKKALAAIAAICPGRGPSTACPLLKQLEVETDDAGNTPAAAARQRTSRVGKAARAAAAMPPATRTTTTTTAGRCASRSALTVLAPACACADRDGERDKEIAH